MGIVLRRFARVKQSLELQRLRSFDPPFECQLRIEALKKLSFRVTWKFQWEPIALMMLTDTRGNKLELQRFIPF
jgi:hypothetical protein